MPKVFEGRKALITGASGGIGAAIARSFSRSGATLLLHYHRGRNAAEQLATELGGNVQLLQANLRSPAEIELLASQVAQPLDILINNAGVWCATPLGSTRQETVDEMLDTNLRAVFWLTQCLVPLLREGACVVNISSVAAKTASASGRSLYRATKAAIDCLTRNWAYELAPRGIRVNAVAPGIIETAMTEQHLADESTRQKLLDRHPLGRFTTAEEVADALTFLCSDQARHITGQVLNVSGGFVI